MNPNYQRDYQQMSHHAVLMVDHKELTVEGLPLQVCEVVPERAPGMMVQGSPAFLVQAYLRLVR